MNKENFTTETDICSIVATGVLDFGNFYDATEAKNRLDAYFAETHLNPNDPNLIFGQLLGLNAVKALITKIDDYNNGQQPQNKIAGIRIYNAMSKRAFLPAPHNTELKEDIIVLPVLADGSDIYKIAPFTDPNMALSNAMPCPNQCGLSFIS